MNWIVNNIKWIMRVSGALTCTTVFAALAPQAALQASFGATLAADPLVDIIVRNWGALITGIGILLIYASDKPAIRPLVLVIASSTKSIFIALVLIFGSQFLGKAGITIGFDTVVVALFVCYLVATRKPQTQL